MKKNFPLLCARRASAILCLCALTATARATASLDDTAKVLAGLPPSAGSPLEALTADPAWKSRAGKFADTWQRFEDRQLSHVRAWADRELPVVRRESPVLYYTFSGPDIVYANAFFPDCRTYVLCGLEPVGAVPDLVALGPEKTGKSLARLHDSLKNVLSLSFFKTAEMGSDFRNTDLPGTTPVLMTFLARLGKTVRGAELVAVGRDGNERPRAASDAIGEGLTPGVKITFDSGPGTPEQTVYFFTADISNEGLAKNPGFANFCRKLEPGAGLVKAASYLMHTEPFSATRDFLMERCKFMLQDDTGIPAEIFADSKWQLRPFGRYVRPIDMFRGYYQKKLAEIHAGGDGVPLEFGVGYYYRVADCNMLLAARDADSIVVASSAPPASDKALEGNGRFPEKGFISDPDGFTHLRSGPGTEHRIVTVIRVNEPFSFRRDGNSWWRVKTGKGNVGFVHSSRIVTSQTLVASNDSAAGTKTPRKTLVELEEEELSIRGDAALTKKERMQKLREIWKQQLAVMGKKAA